MSIQGMDALMAEAGEKAAQVDTMAAETMEAAAPVGDFTAGALNRVVAILNEIMPLFGEESGEYPLFEGDVEALPGEFVTSLSMIATAATDADMADILSLEDLQVADDKDLMLLAGKLKTLSESRDFSQFLKQEAPPSPEPTAVAIEDPLAAAGPAPEVDDELLMERL